MRVPSVEIHVPITLNTHFNVMSCLLTQSVADRASFSGDWKIVFTYGPDSTLSPSSPELAWTVEYPVEFKPVRPSYFERYSYAGTVLERHKHSFESDVVFFMDADILVTGRLDEIVDEANQRKAILGWPAWRPPHNFDLDGYLKASGLYPEQTKLTYSGYGLEFWSPKEVGPYFNGGFIAMPRDLARLVGAEYERELEYLATNHPNYFICQTVLCLIILKLGIDYHGLDMKYNTSSGDLGHIPYLEGPEAQAYFDAALRSISDRRILHYSTTTRDFSKSRDFADWDAVSKFISSPCSGDGGLRVQSALKGLRTSPFPSNTG